MTAAPRVAACVVTAACALLVAGLAAAPRVLDRTPAQQAAPPRLVAIGDLHADLDQARRAFQLAGAIDQRDAWTGGPLVIVQMGDIIGRGPEDLEVLDFVLDLQARAAAAGGAVHVLLGNHEVFAARPDHRWVDPRAFAAFAGLPGLNLRHPAVRMLPAIEQARFAAMMPGGPYARRLAAFPAVLRIGDTVFAHGGVLPMWARYGIDRINADVRAWLAGQAGEPMATQGLDDGSDDDGVMWSRHLSAAPEELACALADESLRLLKAQRMIVAHTVQKQIVSRCDRRVWAIDVGISRYYGGDLQVLEIVGGQDVRIIGSGSR
jgi:hypothetical protein